MYFALDQGIDLPRYRADHRNNRQRRPTLGLAGLLGADGQPAQCKVFGQRPEWGQWPDPVTQAQLEDALTARWISEYVIYS